MDHSVMSCGLENQASLGAHLNAWTFVYLRKHRGPNSMSQVTTI